VGRANEYANTKSNLALPWRALPFCSRKCLGAKLGGSASAIEFGAGSSVGAFGVSIIPAPGPALALLAAGPFAARRRRSV
jgi:hypothetical protein